MRNNNRIPLVSIVGPTASGKTSLAIEIAKCFDAEIVSADSMQIYKGMDIATAKPTLSQQQAIKHHLVGFLDNDKSFSVAQYCDIAHDVIADVYKRGKLPVLVGGTGLYIDSLINNITFVKSDTDLSIREELKQIADTSGVDQLLEMLFDIDPKMAEKLSSQKNIKRIIRAIEVYKLTGVTMTEHNLRSHDQTSPYKTVKIGLKAHDRQFLYDRINQRVDMMVNEGLVDEAKDHLMKNLSSTASMAIGHKELLPYFNNELTLEECIENLKMQTRRYAKRQLTWFKRDEGICWFDIDTKSDIEILEAARSKIKKELFDEE